MSALLQELSHFRFHLYPHGQSSSFRREHQTLIDISQHLSAIQHTISYHSIKLMYRQEDNLLLRIQDHQTNPGRYCHLLSALLQELSHFQIHLYLRDQNSRLHHEHQTSTGMSQSSAILHTVSYHSIKLMCHPADNLLLRIQDHRTNPGRYCRLLSALLQELSHFRFHLYPHGQNSKFHHGNQTSIDK